MSAKQNASDYGCLALECKIVYKGRVNCAYCARPEALPIGGAFSFAERESVNPPARASQKAISGLASSKGFPVGPGLPAGNGEITGRESMGRTLSLLILPFLVISALVTAVLLTAYAWLTQGD